MLCSGLRHNLIFESNLVNSPHKTLNNATVTAGIPYVPRFVVAACESQCKSVM